MFKKLDSKTMLILLTVIIAVVVTLVIQGDASAEEKVVESWNDSTVIVKVNGSDKSQELETIASGKTVTIRSYMGKQNEWAEIDLGGKAGFIKTQYLKDVVFEDYLGYDEEDPWKNYRPLENPLRNVVANPKRITGIVYLRFTPEDDGIIAKRMRNDSVMTVLAEAGYWLQVREEISGIVGFVKADDVTEIPLSPDYIQLIQDSYDD